MDLSDGYFDNSQAVVATKGAAITSAKSVADLKAFKLGAQVGTTSYAYITDNIQPTTAAKVYNDSNGPIAALKARQIDGIVVDLGTAFEITGAQRSGARFFALTKNGAGATARSLEGKPGEGNTDA